VDYNRAEKYMKKSLWYAGAIQTDVT